MVLPRCPGRTGARGRGRVPGHERQVVLEGGTPFVSFSSQRQAQGQAGGSSGLEPRRWLSPMQRASSVWARTLTL